MSGYPDIVASRLGRLGPGASFLPKPFTIDELLQAVRKALASRVGAARLSDAAGHGPGAHEASLVHSTLAARPAVVDRRWLPPPFKRLPAGPSFTPRGCRSRDAPCGR